MPRSPRSTLFPYTTLFRSVVHELVHETPVVRLEWSPDGAHLITASLGGEVTLDRKSTRLNSSHSQISYAVFCLKKKSSDATPVLRSRRSGHPALHARPRAD